MLKYPLIFTLAMIVALGAAIPQTCQAQETAPPGDHPSSLDFQWITLGGNITQITTGAWLTQHNWYGEATMGGLSAFDNRENSFFLGLNMGRRFALKDWLYLGADLGYRHVMPSGSDDPAMDTGKFFTLDARLKIEFILGKHLSTFVGLGTTYLYQGYSLGSESINEGTIFWGVGLL